MRINGKYRCSKCFSVLNSDNEKCLCGCDNSLAVNSDNCLPIGIVLADTYCIGQVIGVGGFGITYVGWDLELDIKIAVKEFFISGYNGRKMSSAEVTSSNLNYVDFETHKERYLKEAKIMASLSDNRGIAKVYGFFRANNTAYIVMQFLEGVSLKNFLGDNCRLSTDDTIRLMMPIMSSLVGVHEKSLIHRDISPENIMVVNGGRNAKLIDFGAAREISTDDRSITIILKHGYAPIEQYQTKGHQGTWTDVYALCATMYRCISGYILPGATDRATKDEVVELCKLEPSCSKSISDVIMRGLSLLPENRIQTVTELEKELLKASQNNESEKRYIPANTENMPGDNLKKSDEKKKSQSRKKTGTVCIVVAFLAVCISLAAVLVIKFQVISNITSMFNKNSEYADNDRNNPVLSEGEPKEESIASAEPTATPEPSGFEKELMELKAANPGDVVEFGNYKDNTEWIVLKRKKDNLLLLSKNAVEKKKFNETQTKISWANSSLRQWLNNDYIDCTFTDEEQRLIIQTEIITDNNFEWGTQGGDNCLDKVFLLSENEVLNFFDSEEERITTYNGGNIDWWWLRSPGADSSFLSDSDEKTGICFFKGVENSKGSVLELGSSMTIEGGVRPAIWVNCSDENQ